MTETLRSQIDIRVRDAKRLLLGKGLDATTYSTVENTLRDLGAMAASEAEKNARLREERDEAVRTTCRRASVLQILGHHPEMTVEEAYAARDEVETLRGALEVTDYLLTLYRMMHERKPVRDLPEAEAAYRAARTALSLNPEGKGDVRGWAAHSPAEIVRRTRCEADETSDAVAWRDCCDLILQRLGKGDRRVPPAASPGYPAEPETIGTIAAWCEETFGAIEPARIAERAAEEMDELRADPTRVEEAADVVIVLSRYPGLWDAVQRKMAVNRARKWRLMGDGTGYHIKADA